MPEWAQALRESVAGYGESLPGSFASYDPDTCSWKTSQLCLGGEWAEFSGIFPRSGMMRNGQLYPRAPWVRHIHGKGCSSLPTPTVHGDYNRKGASATSGNGLATVIGGAPNPEWEEWLMGFPLQWSAVDVSETPSSPK